MKLRDLIEAGLLVVVTVGGIAVAVLWLGGGAVGTRIARVRFGKTDRPADPGDGSPTDGYDHEAPAGGAPASLITITPYENAHGFPELDAEIVRRAMGVSDEHFPPEYWNALPDRRDKR